MMHWTIALLNLISPIWGANDIALSKHTPCKKNLLCHQQSHFCHFWPMSSGKCCQIEILEIALHWTVQCHGSGNGIWSFSPMSCGILRDVVVNGWWFLGWWDRTEVPNSNVTRGPCIIIHWCMCLFEPHGLQLSTRPQQHTTRHVLTVRMTAAMIICPQCNLVDFSGAYQDCHWCSNEKNLAEMFMAMGEMIWPSQSLKGFQ